MAAKDAAVKRTMATEKVSAANDQIFSFMVIGGKLAQEYSNSQKLLAYATGSRFPLKLGAVGKKSCSTDDVPIGNPKSPKAFKGVHFRGLAGPVESKWKGICIAALRQIDPKDTGRVIRAGREDLSFGNRGWSRGGGGIWVGIERTG